MMRSNVLGVLKMAKEKHYNNVLILEDDFIFNVSKEEFEEFIQKFFDLNINYDVCMLSYNEYQTIQETETPFLVKIIKSSNACAYLVNNSYYDKLIEILESSLPLLRDTKAHWIYANDQVWCTLQETDNWYGFKPLLGRQNSRGDSDTTDGFSSY